MASLKKIEEQHRNIRKVIEIIRQSPHADRFNRQEAYLARVSYCLQEESFSVRNKFCKVLSQVDDLFDEIKNAENISVSGWALDEIIRELSYFVNNGSGLYPKTVRMIEDKPVLFGDND
ncbi:MAG: hypothetical protein PHU71_02625 [Candidatus Gracilibacteria bacterium]|nr:hypothetical protein [Candidatus Gracilibacteria bacterium]